ncbi:MAG: hypothetical protein IKV48_07900 [Eggerthellaceae bacterium]|nr:hypothetical protein [Eggerthellaceae bacterium]
MSDQRENMNEQLDGMGERFDGVGGQLTSVGRKDVGEQLASAEREDCVMLDPARNAANPRVTLSVLAAALAVLALLCWFAPKDDYSESERRYLASFPSFTFDSVTSGRFMDQFETYAQDSFPLRESFREAQAIANLAFGRLDGNGVYLAKDPDGSGMYACALDYQLDSDAVARSLAKFQLVYDKYLADTDTRVFSAVIPDKGYYLAAPSGHPSLDYAALFAQVEAGMPYAEFVELVDLLEASSYYRTDTHWRQEEILGVANALLVAMADGGATSGDAAADGGVEAGNAAADGGVVPGNAAAGSAAADGAPALNGAPAHLIICGSDSASQDEFAAERGELPEAGSIGGEEGYQQLGSFTVGNEPDVAGEVSQDSDDAADTQSGESGDVDESSESTASGAGESSQPTAFDAGASSQPTASGADTSFQSTASGVGALSEPTASIEFESVLLAEPFYGVYCGQSALPIGFDSLMYLENEITNAAVAYDWENGREIPLYDVEFAYASPLDAYEIFLGGPLSLVTVESPLARTDRELVIFRDSFGSSLAPLFLGEYAKVTLIDLRYIQPDRLADYVDFDGVDVLFLQSTLTLNLG